MIDLDTPEGLAAIKGAPQTVGFRGSPRVIPTVFMFLSSGPDMAVAIPSKPTPVGNFIPWDVNRPSCPRRNVYFHEHEDGQGTGEMLRTDIHADHVVVYLEHRDKPETLVRLFRTLRDLYDPGLRLCDNRGEPLFEGEVR